MMQQKGLHVEGKLEHEFWVFSGKIPEIQCNNSHLLG